MGICRFYRMMPFLLKNCPALRNAGQFILTNWKYHGFILLSSDFFMLPRHAYFLCQIILQDFHVSKAHLLK